MIIEFFFYVFLVGAITAALAYFSDKHEREPLFSVFYAIILGITSALLVVIIRKIVPLPDYTPSPSWGNALLVSFFSAGFIEELAKFTLILGIIYKWKDFNEYYDGPLYAGLVGIGFAIYVAEAPLPASRPRLINLNHSSYSPMSSRINSPRRFAGVILNVPPPLMLSRIPIPL